MAKPIFSFRDASVEGNAVRIASFEIPGGATTPSEFAAAVAEIEKNLAGEFGVIFDGRGPVWGYGMLLHAAHPTRFVACRDPRLGAVIVQSHQERWQVGEVIAFPEAAPATSV